MSLQDYLQEIKAERQLVEENKIAADRAKAQEKKDALFAYVQKVLPTFWTYNCQQGLILDVTLVKVPGYDEHQGHDQPALLLEDEKNKGRKYLLYFYVNKGRNNYMALSVYQGEFEVIDFAKTAVVNIFDTEGDKALLYLFEQLKHPV